MNYCKKYLSEPHKGGENRITEFIDMDISEKIKQLRKKTGLSQSKFSAKFGIPVRTLQQWEQGISAPPEYLVRMMAYIMLLEERFELD